MKLKEKIDNAIWENSSSEVVDKLEQIADEFAIDFAEWLLENQSNSRNTQQLLEIYKKTLWKKRQNN